MIGAHHRLAARGLRQPCVLAMVGTAVTVEAIDAQGRFLGGLILPGHGIMLRALESGTAGLHVPTGEVRNFPTNTSDALTSGGTFAIAGAIERMVQNVREHCGQAPACIMTGGAGWKMVPSMQRPFELVDNLIFDGLLEIARRRLHPGGAPG
jgi:type III pantothenate kinase